jgi:hypothetical protein
MANIALTLSPGSSVQITGATQVDSTGNPLTTPDPNYGAAVWVSNDTTIVTITSSGPGLPTITSTGKVGETTVTGTETSSVTTDPTLTGTVTVTVSGPVPASILPVLGTPTT